MTQETTFNQFRNAVNNQLSIMTKDENPLFKVAISKDDIWEHYLKAFPAEANPIYRTNTVHDCNCCRQFVQALGNVVAEVNGRLVSIWDDLDIGYPYQEVAEVLADMVSNTSIQRVYLSSEKTIGHKNTLNIGDNDKASSFDHFYFKLPNHCVESTDRIGSRLSKLDAYKGVLERSILEISDEAVEIVLDLIDQNSIYRGEEHKFTVQLLETIKEEYAAIHEGHREWYLWDKAYHLKEASKIKNTVIGTLLEDISGGMDLDKAVKRFEDKVAPTNYKRPKAVVTQGMIKKAQEKVAELGIEDALQRRYATINDITINNVLFADRTAKKAMNVFDELSAETVDKVPDLNKVEEISIDEFVENVVPKVSTIEVMTENKHEGNLVSLIAPADAEAKQILKWGNNFSWSYNGGVTDSIRAKVKAAGGNVEGDLRASLSWYNPDDLDIHVKGPGNEHIFHGKKVGHRSGGELDVDMNAGRHNSDFEPVENITWADKNQITEGTYEVLVHNFKKRLTDREGFVAELEFDGKIHTFVYDKPVRDNEIISVVKFNYSHENGVEIIKSLPSTEATKEVWGLSTQKFQKVSTIMNSPNHWDGEHTGNKHWFFMLEGCKNPEPTRGLYNEFLKPELNEHRKVFEVLGNKLKVEPSDKQLSGLGFSSTKKDAILCRVKGSFNRTLLVNF